MINAQDLESAGFEPVDSDFDGECWQHRTGLMIYSLGILHLNPPRQRFYVMDDLGTFRLIESTTQLEALIKSQKVISCHNDSAKNFDKEDGISGVVMREARKKKAIDDIRSLFERYNDKCIAKKDFPQRLKRILKKHFGNKPAPITLKDVLGATNDQ